VPAQTPTQGEDQGKGSARSVPARGPLAYSRGQLGIATWHGSGDKGGTGDGTSRAYVIPRLNDTRAYVSPGTAIHARRPRPSAH